jgi:hypothetical protein
LMPRMRPNNHGRKSMNARAVKHQIVGMFQLFLIRGAAHERQ